MGRRFWREGGNTYYLDQVSVPQAGFVIFTQNEQGIELANPPVRKLYHSPEDILGIDIGNHELLPTSVDIGNYELDQIN